MAQPTMRERTIGFYEVVRLKDGKQLRIDQLDFPTVLAAMSSAKLAKRRHDADDQTLVGTVYTYDETDQLLLHRVKDAGEWLSVINMETGDWHELESKASEGYLETSAMAFLTYGNVVGIMQGSTSAPSHKGLERWLNGLKPFGKETNLVVRPLVSKAQVDELKTADGATKVDIRFGTAHAAALAGKQGRLAQLITRTMEDYGDARVTLTISIPRGGSRGEQRRALRDDLRDLSDVMPDNADVARAKLVFADAGGAEYARLAEFVEHHITAKRRVLAVDEEGNSIKLSEALRIISQVASEHEDELREAADVSE